MRAPGLIIKSGDCALRYRAGIVDEDVDSAAVAASLIALSGRTDQARDK